MGNFVTSCATSTFLRRTLFQVVSVIRLVFVRDYIPLLYEPAYRYHGKRKLRSFFLGGGAIAPLCYCLSIDVNHSEVKVWIAMLSSYC